MHDWSFYAQSMFYLFIYLFFIFLFIFLFSNFETKKLLFVSFVQCHFDYACVPTQQTSDYSK